MKKRIFVTAICIGMLLVSNACSKKNEETETRGIDYFTMPVPIETEAVETVNVTEKEEENSETETEVLADGKGVINGDSYVNELFGIEFNLPSGFEFLPLNVDGQSNFMGESEYQMWAGDSTGNNVNIVYVEMIMELDMSELGDQFTATIMSQYEQLGIESQVSNKGEVDFLNNKAYYFEVSAEYLGVDLDQEIYIMQRGEKYIVISFSGTDAGAIDTLKKGFKAL